MTSASTCGAARRAWHTSPTPAWAASSWWIWPPGGVGATSPPPRPSGPTRLLGHRQRAAALAAPPRQQAQGAEVLLGRHRHQPRRQDALLLPDRQPPSVQRQHRRAGGPHDERGRRGGDSEGPGPQSRVRRPGKRRGGKPLCDRRGASRRRQAFAVRQVRDDPDDAARLRLDGYDVRRHDGYLYVTANQLEQQGSYHYGKDLRKKPYTLYRVRIGQKPVLLK